MATENLIILGTGPAGYTAAIYSARAGIGPLVIEGTQPGGQLTTTTDIENFPGFHEGIDGFTLMMQMRQQAEKFGARILSATVVGAHLRTPPMRLDLEDGSSLETRALIIATGASARYLGLPAEQALRGRGVSACATCDGAFHKGRPVAVVGGGDTAMEEACFLARFASRVHLIHRRDQFRASKILAERVRRNPKIEIHWNSVVDDILDPAQGKVTAVWVRNLVTGERRKIDCTGFFSAIGHHPNTEMFAGQLERDPEGYLLTRNTRTSLPGVFAAGDVQDPVYRQAVTAVGSGCMAAIEAQRYLEGL